MPRPLGRRASQVVLLQKQCTNIAIRSSPSRSPPTGVHFFELFPVVSRTARDFAQCGFTVRAAATAVTPGRDGEVAIAHFCATRRRSITSRERASLRRSPLGIYGVHCCGCLVDVNNSQRSAQVAYLLLDASPDSRKILTTSGSKCFPACAFMYSSAFSWVQALR